MYSWALNICTYHKNLVFPSVISERNDRKSTKTEIVVKTILPLYRGLRPLKDTLYLGDTSTI